MPIYDAKTLTRVREVSEAALELVERADEESIIIALTTGQHTEDYVYSFDIDGKSIYGVGIDGAVEIAKEMGNIEILSDIKIDEQPQHYFAVVRVKDLVKNVTFMGSCRQPKFKVLKGGALSTKPDEHAFTIAIRKATRNAILDVASHRVVMAVIERFVKTGKVRKLTPVFSPTLAAPGTNLATQIADATEEKPKQASSSTTEESPESKTIISASEVTELLKKSLRQQVVKLLTGKEGLMMSGPQAADFLAKQCDGKRAPKELSLEELQKVIAMAEEMLSIKDSPETPE